MDPAIDNLGRFLDKTIAELKMTDIPQNAMKSPPPLPQKPVAGGFSSQVKAMMEKARNDLAKVQSDALATVQDGLNEMTNAGTVMTNVAVTTAKNMKAEAASILADIGQISNMPPD